MPTRAQLIRGCIIVLAVVAVALVLIWSQRGADGAEGGGYPEVERGVSQPEVELRYVDSVTGLPLRRIPTDLGGEVFFTDTLGER